MIIAGAGAGAIGLQGFASRSDALADARQETSHQVRLQIIRTSLEIADTAASDDVLKGPEPDRLASRDFGYALRPAAAGLVTAARQDQDAAQLALASRWLSQYTMQIETARRLSRVSRTQAAASLSAASALLRSQILPRLFSVQDASQARLAGDESRATRGGLLALLSMVLALLAIGAVHWWLTLRTRRFINLGLAAGLVMLSVATISGAALFGVSQRHVADLRSGPWRVARALVDARVAAFDARADEALGVVTGNVPSAETRWRSLLASARTSLATASVGSSPEVRPELRSAAELLGAYAGVHATLLAQARAGRQASTEQIAIGPADDGSAGSFSGFDVTTGALLARQTQAADDGWAAAQASQDLAGWLCLAAGVGAATTGLGGIGQRRREYR